MSMLTYFGLIVLNFEVFVLIVEEPLRLALLGTSPERGGKRGTACAR